MWRLSLQALLCRFVLRADKNRQRKSRRGQDGDSVVNFSLAVDSQLGGGGLGAAMVAAAARPTSAVYTASICM